MPISYLNKVKKGAGAPFFVLALIAFTLIAFLLYWQGLSGPFLLDDLQSIEPAKLDVFSLSRLLEISLQNDSGPLGRPISIASFALNDYFFGLDPFYFKIVNLIIHVLCGMCVAFFAYLVMLFMPRAKRYAELIGFFTGLLWLIHPLQVSTVLYPVQRMTQLCHLFILLGLNTYLCGRIKQLTHKPHSSLILVMSFAFFFPLAVLSKETGILFPWYVLITECFILRFQGTKIQSRCLKWFHISLSATILICAFIYYWQHFDTFMALFADKRITLLDRVYTQINALVFYLKLIIIPQLTDMGLYHDDFIITRTIDVQTALCSLLLGSMALLVIFLRKRAPMVSFGIAWFFVSHAIESTVLPLEMVFEHRNYLASVGLLLIATYYFIPFYKKVDIAPKRFYYIFTFLFISLLAAITFQRSYIWSSSERFLQESRIQHPRSPRVHIEIANLFLKERLYQQAFEELDEAARLDPFNAGIPLHKILIFCHLNRVPPQLYQEANQKIQQGAITPYVITVLDIMVQNLFNNQCKGVDRKKVIELIQACNENQNLKYKPKYKAVLYHLESGLELLNNNLDNSRYLLLESYKAYPKRIEPLIQKAYLEMKHNMLKEAEKSIAFAHHELKDNKAAKSTLQKLDFTMQTLKQHEKKEASE
ncbi:MAG: tetratricopeptide repeat protein [Candidatus Berkiella sp.]